MLEVVGEQVAQVARSHRSAHSFDRAANDPTGRLEVGVGSGARGQLREQLGAAIAARLDQQPMLALQDLGQGEVVARLRRGPVPIETQKHVLAGSPQLTATRNVPSRRAA